MNDFINDSLQAKLHSSLKITQLWPQFLEAIAEEMTLSKEIDDETRYYRDINNLLEDGNIQLSKDFGYTQNLIINNSLEYTRLQSTSIPYRLRRKTTYSGYYINFRMIDRAGEIYNLFFDSAKLVKSLNWNSIFTDILTADFTQPFKNIYTNKNFNASSLGNVSLLDDGDFLDEEPPLLLDNLVDASSTKHITIELVCDQIILRELKEYLFYDNYFKYLELGSEYNRHASIVPHNGCQLTILTSADGGYNFYNPTSQYSVPKLKIKSAVVFNYLKNYSITGLASLDATPSRDLDEPITYTLDGETTVTTPIILEDYVYLSIGGGVNTLPDTIHKNLLNDVSTMFLYYTLNDLDSTFTIKDSSSNSKDGLLTGNLVKIPSILGSAVNFDSSTKVTTTNVSILNVDYNINFWFNAESFSNSECIFDFTFLICEYKYVDEELSITFNAIENLIPVLHGEHYVNIEIDYNSNMYVYVDSILVDTINISGVSISGLYTLTIGANNSNIHYFKGFISDFSIFLKTFTQVEKEYIYNNKLGLITKLNNIYNRVTLSLFEKQASGDLLFYGLQSTNKANFINDEFLFNYSTGIDTYLGNLKNVNIIPYSAGISFLRFTGSIQVIEKAFDSGNGTFNTTYISGTIDYASGAYSIITYDIKNEYNKILFTPTIGTPSITTISTALNALIERNSLTIFYTIGGQLYSAIDDGNVGATGTITGTGITSGTITYATGVLNITFSSPTTAGTYVNARYEYKIIPIIDNNAEFLIEYNTESLLEVTEVALENADKEVLIYATFPPIEFNNIYNHLATTFILKK